ncbi:DUF1574 family protein [Bacillus suaedae]|uniref:DUF1574 family protein n=1 Tax=Halalkalibacter suaedae TaxID=2822140 RepID=A0A941ATT2_9BACI|nr:DUF1574 family protein [Bacillus suaedae]MBP3952649.1 DUF1574 family protein [Bacillus suaedae]
MNDKKWVIVFLAILLTFLSLTYSLRYTAQQFVYDLERATWKAKSSMIDNINTYSYDYLIIGTSRTLALNPSYLSRNYNTETVNLSVGGATAPSVYFFVERLLEQDIKPKKIYIELNPMNLTSHDTNVQTTLGERFIRFVAKKDEAIDLSTYDSSALEKYRRINSFPFNDYFYKDNGTLIEGIRRRLNNRLSDGQMIEKLKDNKGFFLFGKDTLDFSEINNQINTADAIHYGEYIHTYTTQEIPVLTQVYFKRLLEKLESSNIDYHFFFSPMPQGRKMIENLSFGKMTELYNQIDKDKITSSVLLLDEKYFSDPSHVNYRGSIKYNDYFNQCIVTADCTFDTYELELEGSE